MAVTKIRKTSSITLLVLAAITLAVLLMFFLGGYVDPNAAEPEPVYTGYLLIWTYVILGLAIVATVFFGLVTFISSFKHNPKQAITTLVVLALFVLLLVVTYFVGSTEKLPLSQDFQEYNTPQWLKTTDMFLFSTYILLGLCILGVIVGAVKTMFVKK